jgi:adenosine deaminase
LEKLLKENKRSEFKNKIQSIRETKSVTFADLQPFLEQYYQNQTDLGSLNIPRSSDNKVNRSAIVTNNQWKSIIQRDFGISSSDIADDKQWNSKNI